MRDNNLVLAAVTVFVLITVTAMVLGMPPGPAILLGLLLTVVGLISYGSGVWDVVRGGRMDEVSRYCDDDDRRLRGQGPLEIDRAELAGRDGCEAGEDNDVEAA